TRHSGGVDRTAIEERDLSRTPWVCPVEHRDATLVPRLHHHVPTRNWNQRAVMGDTVLLRRLRSGKLVVALELHCLSGRVRVRDATSHYRVAARISRKREDRVCAPLASVGDTTLRLSTAAPFVREKNLGSGVIERRRMPIREIGVSHRGDAPGVGRITN